MPGLPATEAEPGPAQLPPRRPVPATLHRPHPACYAFQVQRQDPAKYMPIEDTSVEWKESDAPFATIADIIVPAQDFDSREQNLFCDNLSFNPWHALPEHRPIGGINRLRKAVYEAVSGYRLGGMGEGLGGGVLGVTLIGNGQNRPETAIRSTRFQVYQARGASPLSTLTRTRSYRLIHDHQLTVSGR